MLVLVADQDPGYAEFIGELLRRQSHRVVLAATADSFQHFVDRSSANLIIVSANLIEGSTAEMVRDLSRHQTAPIVVTHDNAGPMEIAAILGAGADDCVQKPFHPTEFAARVEAIVRRSREPRVIENDTDNENQGAATTAAATAQITGQGLEFDRANDRAYYDGKDLQSSQLEYNILNIMASMDGQVLSHAFLNARVWGYPNLTDGTLLKGHVSSIRRKVRAAGLNRPLIRTIYGVGYALSA